MTAQAQPWWQTGVIYQIYPRSFADSNGDGIGDLRGLIDRLDYLRGGANSLNVDAIWLSPINVSPMADFGYDVADYFEIDPLFGTLADFDELLEKAHARGLKIIMDMVFNHTSDQHAWFQESRATRANPKRDWYIWRDPQPDGSPPNNWQAFFGGPAWTLDETTGQYYLHLFLPQQPDLNWRNPAVKAAIFEVMRFWFDRGVDGYRLDVFNLFYKDADLRDNPFGIGGRSLGLRAFDRQQHRYDRDQPETHQALREMRQLADSYPGERVLLGETVGNDPALVASYLGENADELHLAFNFSFTEQRWVPRGFLQAVTEGQAALPPGGWSVYTLSNHDVDRHISRFGGGPSGDARAKVAAALLLSVPGTPVLYYGEELALRNGNLKREQVLDPPGKRFWPAYKGRDGARTPLPWSAEVGAGFTQGQPWLPIAPDYASRNVAVQQQTAESVWQFYQQLLRLRDKMPPLKRGSFYPLVTRPVEGLAYLRQTEHSQVMVLLNFYGWAVNLTFDNPLSTLRWQVLLSTRPSAPLKLQIGTGVYLEPYEVLILAPAD